MKFAELMLKKAKKHYTIPKQEIGKSLRTYNLTIHYVILM